ncbi:MAG: hypothetical protein JSW53_04615 [Candidatus Bathyarchaeota archaeon]|nr:MAG: hypothetical protein JSW53_04615 [Candidatus Bathyarchaeota archaeon]
MERSEEEANRSSEKILVSDLSYDVEEGLVHLEGIVTNESPVPVQITTLWVLHKVTEKHGFNDMVDINLKAGDSLNFTGSEALTVAVEGLEADNSSNAFASWFVTARGNLIPLEEEREWIQYNYTTINITEPSGGNPKVIIGSLMLDLETFRYFTYTSFNHLSDYPGGIRGYNVPASTDMAFGCMVTNVDPANRSIVLDSHSLLWFTLPVSDVPHNRWWYTVDVADDGTISTSYSDVVLTHGETRLIVFASADDTGSSSFSRQNTPKGGVSVSVFLLFHGTIGGEPWGQNIPFVSVYIR